MAQQEVSAREQLLSAIRACLREGPEIHQVLDYTLFAYRVAISSEVNVFTGPPVTVPRSYSVRMLVREALELLLDNTGLRWRSCKDDPPEIGRPVLFTNRSIEYARVGYRADDAGLVEYVFNILSDMGRVQAAPVWWCAIPETPKK